MNERNELKAALRINREIDRLGPDAVVSRSTAQLIAAALHRGADSELKRFAETGAIARHQVARLELFYTMVGEPRFASWAATLRDYITEDERKHDHGGAQ